MKKENSQGLSNKLPNKTSLVLKNLGPAVFALATSQPWLAVIFTGAVGFLGLFGDLAQKRLNELIKAMNQNKDNFAHDSIKSHPNKFRAVFLDVLDKLIRETSEEKRKLLKNYLINTFKGIEKDFNYHSRFSWVINNITLDELKIISNFSEIPPQQIEKGKTLNIEDFGVGTSHIQQFFRNQGVNFDEDYIESLLWSLTVYGFIIAKTGRWNGTFWRGPTYLGKNFLKFIKD